MTPETKFAHPVSGYAFKKVTRIVAILITAIVVVFIAIALLSGGQMQTPMAMMFIATAIAMCVMCRYIASGQTTIDSVGIRQDWIHGKNYTWPEIKRASVVSMPLVTRLLINTGRPPFKTITAGTPELVKAFKDVQLLLDPHANP